LISVEAESSTNEALAKVAIFLGETRDEKTQTELEDYEIRLIASLFAVVETTKDKMIASFLLNFLRLRVSYKRQGRKELLDVARSSTQREDMKVSRLRQFFSGVRG
jgi:hypothetical protein